MKRVFSVMLALLMLVSCAPLALARSAGTAATKINTANITGLTLPPAGGTYVGDALAYSVPAGSHFSVTGISWYDETQGRELLSSETFTVGNSCFLIINLKADTGCEFHTNTVCYLNGDAMNIDPTETYPTNGSTQMHVASVPYTIAAPLTAVANVYITEVEWPPVAGGKVSDYMGSSAYGGEPYNIYGLEWYDSSNNVLSGSETFGYGKTYYFKFNVKAYAGYEFTSSTVAYINDDSDLVDPAETYVFPSDSTQMCVTSISYTTESLSEISEISISGFSYPPQAGEEAGDYMDFSFPVNAPYTVDNCSWYCEDDGSDLDTDDVFEDGAQYSFYWTVKAKTGYQFTADTAVVINGDMDIVDSTYTKISNNNPSIFYIWTLPYTVTAPEVIDEIAVEYLDYPPEAGEKAGAHMGYMINDEHFTVTKSFWLHEDTGAEMDANGEFIAGHEYSFCIKLKADDGYLFDNNTYVTINGDTSIVDSVYTHPLQSDDTVFIIWTAAYEIPEDTKIDKVDVVNLDYPPVTYERIGDNLGGLALPTAYSTLDDVFWYDETDGTVQGANDIFHANHEYRLFIELSAFEGYCYYGETEFVLNNGRVEVDTVSYDGPHKALIGTKTVTPRKEIESVAVNSVVWPPQIGAAAGDYMQCLLPDDAHYSLDVITIYEWTLFTPLNANDELLAGHTYMIEITLRADDGYRFTSDTIPTINGGDMTAYMYLDDATHISVYTDAATLADPIPAVDVTGVDYPPVTGETAGNSLNADIPSDAHCVITEIFWYDDGNHYNMTESDVFENGGWYSLCITLHAENGYAFDQNTTVTINGTAEYIDTVYNNVTSITIWMKPYNIRVEIIDEVTVNNVDLPPVAGEKAGDHADFILPDDAHYSVYEAVWFDETVGHFLNGDEEFTEDHVYTLTIELTAENGYEFAGDANILLNGGTDILDEGYVLNNDPTGFAILTKPFAAVPASSFIDTIVLSGVDFIPVPGEKVGDHTGYTISNSAHYFVKTIRWYDNTAEELLLSADTFRAGHRYSMYLEFEAEQGYYLANEVAVIVSGANGVAEIESVQIEGNTAKVVTKGIICGADTLEVISEINVICDKLVPVTGQKAGDFRACSVPEGAHYRVVEVIWLSTSQNRGLEDDEAFVADEYYVLVFAIEADEGYIFADDLVMLLNGGTDYDATYTYHTEIDGAIVLPARPAEEAPAVTIGDINGDGKVNTADAVVVLKYAAGMVQLDDNQLTAADTNHDGKVNTADAVLILKYAAGMIAEF